MLKEALAIDANQLHPRTELAKVYQVQKRYDEAEKRLKEYLELNPKGLQPRTELSRVYINKGLLRRARAEVLSFFGENQDADPEDIAHLLKNYLNACYYMRGY